MGWADARDQRNEERVSCLSSSFDKHRLMTKYRYINHNNLPVMRAFFPSMRLEELDAGHWGTSADFFCLNGVPNGYLSSC